MDLSNTIIFELFSTNLILNFIPRFRNRFSSIISNNSLSAYTRLARQVHDITVTHSFRSLGVSAVQTGVL